VVETETAMLRAGELLAAGGVGVRFTDGWRTRALVRDDRTILTVVYENGRWRCSCQRPGDCAHVAAVASVVRVV
jgi:hypothetical protein